ncbi:glycosyltransferase [Heyndrickxia acidicola]|uniref:Glycosyltransferase n=1 Tax=Heyndrickxia acidicola TaxID=209389 RepID=A0ABU6MFL6_9BACI|nr:glycosyltransferase [Heyndrickxia acidicola]MED1203461.1 glycosyltransferase [Heyndrickxia acidicola]
MKKKSSENPKVSIIIPTYNCRYTDQAIISAMNQTYSNKEIIVIDDGSTQEFDKIIPYLSSIRYCWKPNGGTGSALNLGIEQASGDYFSWLSSDDLFEPDKLEKQVWFMISQHYDVSYTNYSFIDVDSNVTGRSVGLHFPSKKDFYNRFKTFCHINGCTVMMKMDVIKKVGLFNENLRYTQDFEYWLRVIQHYDFHYLDEPLVNYRVHSESESFKSADAQLQEIYQLNDKYRPMLEEMIQKEEEA